MNNPRWGVAVMCGAVLALGVLVAPSPAGAAELAYRVTAAGKTTGPTRVTLSQDNPNNPGAFVFANQTDPDGEALYCLDTVLRGQVALGPAVAGSSIGSIATTSASACYLLLTSTSARSITVTQQRVAILQAIAPTSDDGDTAFQIADYQVRIDGGPSCRFTLTGTASGGIMNADGVALITGNPAASFTVSAAQTADCPNRFTPGDNVVLRSQFDMTTQAGRVRIRSR